MSLFEQRQRAGTSLIVVEQDIKQAISIADRVYCLREGRVALEGTVRLTREQIMEAYFGIQYYEGLF